MTDNIAVADIDSEFDKDVNVDEDVVEDVDSLFENIKKREGMQNIDKAQFTEMITMNKRLASKSVLNLVICTMNDKPTPKTKKVVDKINKIMPYKDSGYVQLGFNEINYKLNICLSLVPATYRTDISVPSDKYVKDLFEQYNNIKVAALAYWQQFCEERPTIVKLIKSVRPDVNWEGLNIDESNPTTLYFDAESTKRIGIFCYYVDENGTAFYKK